jgi:hypothetical protein
MPGDQDQAVRTKTMEDVRSFALRVLVSTDLV